jgi:hypothetical protein
MAFTERPTARGLGDELVGMGRGGGRIARRGEDERRTRAMREGRRRRSSAGGFLSDIKHRVRGALRNQWRTRKGGGSLERCKYLFDTISPAPRHRIEPPRPTRIADSSASLTGHVAPSIKRVQLAWHLISPSALSLPSPSPPWPLM